jgi:hypothetical protein
VIEGEGVVGYHPVLRHGEPAFVYQSQTSATSDYSFFGRFSICSPRNAVQRDPIDDRGHYTVAIDQHAIAATKASCVDLVCWAVKLPIFSLLQVDFLTDHLGVPAIVEYDSLRILLQQEAFDSIF